MTRKDFFLYIAAAFGYRRKKPMDPVFAKRLSPRVMQAMSTFRFYAPIPFAGRTPQRFSIYDIYDSARRGDVS